MNRSPIVSSYASPVSSVPPLRRTLSAFLALSRPLWRPTLLRRVLGALVAAFALVAAALLAIDFVEFKQTMASRPGVQVLAENIVASIATLPEASATAVVSAYADQVRKRRGESGMALADVEFELRHAPQAATPQLTPQGTSPAVKSKAPPVAGAAVGRATEPITSLAVESTAPTVAGAAAARATSPITAPITAPPGPVVFATSRIGAEAVPPPHAPGDAVLIGGAPYWFGQATAGPWQLSIAEPRVGDATVLGWFGRELAGYLLLAFPLVVVPLWIALRRGMRPLTTLASEVERRDAQDLTPLGFQPRHDELVPLVGAFDRLLARLRLQLRRERAFVQDAAHELRTPMAVIAAQAHLLVQARDDAERDAAARALGRALERAAHLSRQLLALAAVDEGRAVPPESFDLAALAQERLAQAAPDAEAKGIALSLDAPERMPVHADRAALESVLGNLVENALRYVPAGGQVAVCLRHEGTDAVLTVIDDGPGIPAHCRDLAFERFWRGDQAGAVPGTGLGLAIVREAARRLGGGVRLDDGQAAEPSRPGLSAEVRFPAGNALR